MTSGKSIHRLLLLGLLTLAAGVPTTQAGPSPNERDTGALIASLAKPAPASIDFTEVRFSRLLRQPLIVAGQLSYSGPASLDRQVTTPYREHTSIRGESVTVEREGEAPRSFALKRAPELRGLLSGFSAMLSGDVAALRETFQVFAGGEDDKWTIELTPTDPKAKRRLEMIAIAGAYNEPRCLSMTTADGAASVLLLGPLSKETVPADVTLESLTERCRFIKVIIALR